MAYAFVISRRGIAAVSRVVTGMNYFSRRRDPNVEWVALVPITHFLIPRRFRGI